VKAAPTQARGVGTPAPAAAPTLESDAIAAEHQAAIDQASLLTMHEQFDEVAAQRSEQMRESDALQSLLMAELKSADETLKKWIAMI